MFDFTWIQMFSFMMLTLQLTAAVTEHTYVVVRVGDEGTLSCGNVTDDQDKCNTTTWLFTSSSNITAITLFEYGNIHKNAKSKSDRLSVTANCSLVIKNVSAEDVGLYTCRKFNKSGQQEGEAITANLCVVNMTAHKENNTVTLSCSVLEYGGCHYTVKWLHKDKDIDNNAKDFETSQSICSANVTFTTSHNAYTSENYDVFKCQVINSESMQQFSFRDRPLSDQTGWWKFILVGLGVAALLITVVTVFRWKRSKENNPTTSKNTVDPEPALTYASISFTKKTENKAQVLGRNANEGDDAVTYSIVKAPSSLSAGDPNGLYANIK